MASCPVMHPEIELLLLLPPRLLLHPLEEEAPGRRRWPRMLSGWAMIYIHFWVQTRGRGSNGLVVEAKCIDPQFPFPEKRYAIKMCLNYDKNYTSEVSNMFVNEFRLLARLDPHPNVIPYLGDMVAVPPDSFFNALTEVEQSMAVYTRRGRTRRRKTQFVFFPCISMDLQQWRRQQEHDGILPYSIFLPLFRQCVAGLLFLHRQSVCHLDLKLDNILFDEGHIFLCDFGLARRFADTKMRSPFTEGSVPGGNIAHLSPEVRLAWRERGNVITASRVYGRQECLPSS